LSEIVVAGAVFLGAEGLAATVLAFFEVVETGGAGGLIGSEVAFEGAGAGAGAGFPAAAFDFVDPITTKNVPMMGFVTKKGFCGPDRSITDLSKVGEALRLINADVDASVYRTGAVESDNSKSCVATILNKYKI
jgi:hypothetical protein